MSRLAIRLTPWLALLAAGCGGGGFGLEGYNLVVADTGYYSTPDNAFCEAMTNNQVMIQLVDYSPICGSGDARDPAKDHTQIDLIFSLGAQSNTANPYMVQKINCTTGPAAPALVRYRHFPAGSDNPDFDAQADSGTIKFTNFDLTGTNPAKGTFDVMFGKNHISGSFESVACN